ncbi:transposase [[Bacillus] enclensis]|uniref:Transposase n=1 Tax=[Bacillus] enclensis TaxID=1402860 RepID=A0A0V8HDQ0_9BACI|nr:transposase [[Bacillus] enclensis]KSU60488.1 transposase [[Bacillus] enclensis]SCC25177.1 transposase [[Bacillus] enclensis]
MGKHHPNEYREYVAKMIVEEDKKATDLAHELEIPYSSIQRWVKHYKEKKTAGQSKEYITPSELEKLKKQHEKEMNALQEENEILKKAMHIFTKKPK